MTLKKVSENSLNHGRQNLKGWKESSDGKYRYFMNDRKSVFDCGYPMESNVRFL